ncbi:MAG TPA: phosphomannomutase [Candidatus Binatia bacterium]
MDKVDRQLFLQYTPTPLAFGTSGLRGLVTDITDLEAYINVKGALRYFSNIGDIRAGGGVIVAGDLRPSTDRIMRACAQAVIDSGCQLENAGKIPTPALIAYAVSTKRAGVMVTGSHIPFDRNGIKVNKSGGEVLKSDEPGIIREVDCVRQEEYGRSASESAFDSAGMLKRAPDLPPVNCSAEEFYVRRYLGSFSRGLSGLRIVVYQHSAVGRDILPRILSELGAEAIPAGRSETFVPIDTENITDEQLDLLEHLVIAAEAGGQPVHAIVSTDGDSDRPLVTAVLSEADRQPGARRVRFLSGDLLGIVVAEYLRADAVAVPISANDAVDRRMKERGASLLKTKIGSPYVVSALNELRRTEKFARIVGWEANGGFLTISDIQLNAGVLPALPTRDSTLSILATLFAAAEQGIGLSTLWDRLPARFGRAGLLDNVSIAVSQAILARLIPYPNVIEVEFDGPSRVLDCTETVTMPVPLEEPTSKKWQQSKAMLSRFFSSGLGFDEIVRLNVLDGVRIYFRNCDIVHIRPSGNAPQLRVYAVSGSQARADEIVSLAVREPDGILRQLERAFT